MYYSTTVIYGGVGGVHGAREATPRDLRDSGVGAGVDKGILLLPACSCC